MGKHRIVIVTVVTLLLSASFSTPAYSYLDPGTGSIIIQALLATAAAAAMVLRVYWGHVRSFFTRRGPKPNDDTLPAEQGGVVGRSREDAGSFRDPRGSVYLVGDRVFRTVMPGAAEDFEFVEDTGLLDHLSNDGLLVPCRKVDPAGAPEINADARYLLEHPRLPFISYPYEWCFPALKAVGNRVSGTR
jgi:hypothetical protein